MSKEEFERIMQQIRENSVYTPEVGENFVTVHDLKVLLEREVK